MTVAKPSSHAAAPSASVAFAATYRGTHAALPGFSSQRSHTAASELLDAAPFRDPNDVDVAVAVEIHERGARRTRPRAARAALIDHVPPRASPARAAP